MSAPSGPGRLSELDQRWLPTFARFAQRVLHPVLAWGRRQSTPPSTLGQTLQDYPLVLGSIVTVLVAAVLVGSFGEPGRTDVSGPAPAPAAPPVAPGGCAPVTALGAAPGTTIGAYVKTSYHHLRCYAERAPNKQTYALVSLKDYFTPGEIRALFGGVEVAEAFARVPGDKLPTEIYRAVLRRGLAELPGDLLANARLAQATAQTYTTLLKTAPAATFIERKQRATYQMLRDSVAHDAAALSRPATCRCIYALVVEVGLVQLADISRISVVRFVDPATPGESLDALVILPIDPRAVQRVPPIGLFGG